MFFGWWQVVAGVITQSVGSGTVVFAYSLIVLALEGEFGASRMAMMWGFTFCNLVSGLASPWLGSLVDRRSMRALMAAGALLLAMGFGTLSFAAAVWHVVICYALFMSFAQVLLGPLTASTLIARWFDRRRGMALGLAAAGASLGGLLFPPLVQYLIASLGWRLACRWLALLILVVTVPPAWLLVVNRPSDRGLLPDGEPHRALQLPHVAADVAVAPLTTAAVLRRGDFWFIGLAIGIMFATLTAMLTNLAPYATGEGISAPQAAALLSAVAVASTVGNLLFGALSDRMDLRWALATSIALTCVALGMFLRGHSTMLISLAAIILGLAGGGILPIWSAMVGKAFGILNYGRVMGLMNPVTTPLVMLGAPLAGRIYDLTGAYQMVFAIFFAAVVFAGLLLTRLQAMGHEPKPAVSVTLAG